MQANFQHSSFNGMEGESGDGRTQDPYTKFLNTPLRFALGGILILFSKDSSDVNARSTPL